MFSVKGSKTDAEKGEAVKHFVKRAINPQLQGVKMIVGYPSILQPINGER